MSENRKLFESQVEDLHKKVSKLIAIAQQDKELFVDVFHKNDTLRSLACAEEDFLQILMDFENV